MKVKINPAKRARAIVLAQDDGDLLVKSDTVPELRAATLISFDGLINQRDQGGFKLLRRLLNANDIFIIRLHCFRQFRTERFNSHSWNHRNFRAKSEAKTIQSINCPRTRV